MLLRMITFWLVALSLIVSGGACFGQTVTFIGSVLNLGPGWRDPSVAKPFNIDGDNIYGTDGYVMYATESLSSGGGEGGNDLVSMPSYLTVQTFASRYSYPSYAAIDDPIPGGTFSGTIRSGLAYKLPTYGQDYRFVTLTLGASVPQVIQVGYYNGGTYNGNNPSEALPQTYELYL